MILFFHVDLKAMKTFSYFVCPDCGSVTVSSSSVSVSCCSKSLKPCLISSEDSSSLALKVENDELFVSINHPMTKDDYITFVALETYDGVILRKLYPEWNESLIFPKRRGRLVWGLSSGEGCCRKV